MTRRSAGPRDRLLGRRAPGFAVADDAGSIRRLAEFRGRPLVLYFYPKDFTSGCTLEAADFRDRWARVRRAGAAVLGVSRDSVASHRAFRKKMRLPFGLLADERGRLCRAYGVWKTKSLYGRTFKGIERSTFVLDAGGTVRRVFRKVSVKGHVDEILAALKEL